MEIQLSNGFFLSAPAAGDIPAFVKHLNDPYIYARTLMLPEKYTEKDGQFFVDLCAQHEKIFGHVVHFNIRKPGGEAIGGIGFHGKNTVPGIAHKDEIGYWLATDYRGKGIMTEAVKAICAYGFSVRNLVRIEAPVYDFNKESAAVLERNGFVCEGIMRKAYFRNNEYHDAKLFALVR